MGASSAAKRQEDANVLATGWQAFKIWRKSRPFWGGLFTLLAAIELWCIPFLNQLLLGGLNLKIGGIAGVSTIIITPMMVVMAFCMWFAPNYRVFAAIFTLIVSLLALNVSNFGGFLIGTIMGTVGGGLAFAWSPQLSPEQIAAQERAAAAYRQALTEEDAPAAAAAPIFPAAQTYPQFAPTLPQADVPLTHQTVATPPSQRQYPESALADPLNTRAATNSEVGGPPPLPSADDTPLGA